MSTKSTAKYLPWPDVYNCIQEIYDEIKRNGIKIESIIGIQLGGLVPGLLLAKMLKMSQIETVAWEQTQTSGGYWNFSKLPSDEGVHLIIDDISDSGETLRSLVSTIQTNFPNVKILTATLLCKLDSSFKPTFVGQKIGYSNWTIFPWEWKEML